MPKTMWERFVLAGGGGGDGGDGGGGGGMGEDDEEDLSSGMRKGAVWLQEHERER